jgi:HD superfamily phosphohydrolase
MHVASTILRRIEERSGTRFDVDELVTARTLALLHDVSHVPFGHALEDEMALLGRHDRNADRLGRLLSPKNPLGKKLSGSTTGRVVLECLRGNKSCEVQWLTELIDAPSGADVLDYIDRDAYSCGLDHRIDSAVYRRFSV